MTSLATVDDVIARMHQIESSPDIDGAGVFNHLYLRVTEMVRDALSQGTVFEDNDFMTALDVAFAELWFQAYDAEPGSEPKAWAPLFERRHAELYPIQFALAGVNAHIEHDLPLCVVATCRQRNRQPDDVRDDYEKVNDLLATVEAEIRRSFLTDVERRIDDHIGSVAHLVSAWKIDKARDVAWINVQLLWELRGSAFFTGLHLDALARTVGMGSRLLLTPAL